MCWGGGGLVVRNIVRGGFLEFFFFRMYGRGFLFLYYLVNSVFLRYLGY